MAEETSGRIRKGIPEEISEEYTKNLLELLHNKVQ